MQVVETYSPLREALRGLHRRLLRKIQKRKWSIIVIGDSGVGKTLLVELLTEEDPNLTVSASGRGSCLALCTANAAEQYIPTTKIERHDDAKGHCTLTEVPGSTVLMFSATVQLLAQYDLIVVVFHMDREDPESYYESLWPGERQPPVPVLFVGNSSTVPEKSKSRRFWYLLRGGSLCRYFPVDLHDKDSCKDLLAYLRSGAWSRPKTT